MQYLLTANGMSADDVILEYKSEATEVASVLAEDPTAIGLLPQPFVTAACMQNDALKVIFDLNEEWNKVQGEDGSSMVTGVTVVRKEFLEENEEANPLWKIIRQVRKTSMQTLPPVLHWQWKPRS